MKLLRGKKVLVTRPQGQADELVVSIEAAGGRAIHCPVIVIEPLADSDNVQRQQGKQRFMSLDQFQHVIFISSNAVKYGLQWIDQYWPQLPVDILWYGIGRSTTQLLQQEGVPVSDTVELGAMNSESLLQQKSLQELSHQKVLIVRGVGGRDYLHSVLQQRGAVVEYAECYRRKVAAASTELIEKIKEHDINTVCLNSGDSVENFCQLVGSEHWSIIKDLLIVVPGARVAEIAGKKGFENVVCAENASNQAMITAIGEENQSVVS
ncbi:MAG: uroporphyrinogen-III synthase [Oceanicoccus sp.]